MMASSENKTKPTKASPAKFIESVEHPQRKTDAKALLKWFEEVTGLKPKMWGPSLIGYGRYHYKYESGREGEMLMTGFSPRKANLVLYIMPGYQFDSMQEKLARLGKYKTGKSCLYINKLADIDREVLREIVEEGIRYMRKNYDTFDA
jgi:hypothetical protein